MSGNGSNSCDCGWLRALCEKLLKELHRRDEETNHLKDLLWKSSESWADKERAIQEDIIRASEVVLDDNAGEQMD